MFILKRTNPDTPAAKALLRRARNRASVRESHARHRKLCAMRKAGAEWAEMLRAFPKSGRMIATLREKECRAHLKVSREIGHTRLAVPPGLILTTRGLERKARKSARHRVTPGVTKSPCPTAIPSG